MTDALIIDAVRTPLGTGGCKGALAAVRPVDLLAQTLTGLVRRVEIDPAGVDGVIVDRADWLCGPAGDFGRRAWRAAGLSKREPAVLGAKTMGQGRPAMLVAIRGVLTGKYDCVVAAGVNWASHSHPSPADPLTCGRVPKWISADRIASTWGLDRDDLDCYAEQSHTRAALCADAGDFDREITPISVRDGVGTRVVTYDETIRLGLSPTPRPTTSQICDAGSAVLIMSKERAGILGLEARARFHAFTTVADEPGMPVPAPIAATEKLLNQSRMKIRDIDHFEVDEALAAIPLAWQAEYGANPDLLNPRGGAIALGDPLGASGGRLMATMLGALEDTGGRFGLQTAYDTGGRAAALIVERM